LAVKGETSMQESVLLAAQRAWVEGDRFRNIMQGEWLPLTQR
jgi:hypothetical protein